MNDEIYVWKDGRWIWTSQTIPEHMYKSYYARVKIGCHWTDAQVSQFVDEYLVEFLEDEI